MLLTSVLVLFTKVEYTIYIYVNVRTMSEKKYDSIKMAKLFKTNVFSAFS